MAVRKTIYYSGRVQGVGFRYTTARVARGLHVTGYVRNLPDGRVEVVAEGRRDEVESFVERLADQMSGYIRGVDAREANASGEFADFQVRF